MINSIPTIETKHNAFGDMTKRTTPSDFWLAENSKIKSKKDRKDNKIVIMTPEEARATKNIKLIGLSIAGAMVLTAAGLFFFLKGGSKGLSSNFKKLRNYLESKVQNAKLNKSGNDLVTKAYALLIKNLDGALQKFEAVNNFTTFKDLLFKKIMYSNFGFKKFASKSNWGAKIHSGVTRVFEKIGRQSVVNSYQKTAGIMTERKLLCAQIEKNILAKNPYDIVEINGIRRTKAQWLMQISKMNDELSKNYNLHFGTSALTGRYLKIKKTTDGLNSYFEDLGTFLSKNTLNSFVSDSFIYSDKLKIQNAVKGFRKNLSYSISDMAKESEDKVMQMTQSVNYKDVDKLNILNSIRTGFKTLVKSKTNKNEITQKILGDIDTFNKLVKSDSSLGKKDTDLLLSSADELKKSLSEFKQGKVEDILSLYKHLLSPDDYYRVEKSYKNSIKSLDKSINIETEEFISKVRDLTTGGAPTDILTVLGSFATLSYQLGKSDNNDERASISLKYGIPALAGIGVSLYCNAKLFAGTKSMLVASISGLIVNQIGSWADKMLKKHKAAKLSANNQNPQQVQNSNSDVLDLTKIDTKSA